MTISFHLRVLEAIRDPVFVCPYLDQANWCRGKRVGRRDLVRDPTI